MNKFISVVCFALYNAIGKKMPKSDSRLSFGSKVVRRVLARGFTEHIGRNANIEKGAVFGRKIWLGDNSGIGIDCVLQGKISISNNVMMGPEVYIYTRNHKHESRTIPMIEQGFEEERPVVIDEDVWIGSRVTILPGVYVGKGSIIGTGSVVTKDVPQYVIVAGNPARVVKERDE